MNGLSDGVPSTKHQTLAIKSRACNVVTLGESIVFDSMAGVAHPPYLVKQHANFLPVGEPAYSATPGLLRSSVGIGPGRPVDQEYFYFYFDKQHDRIGHIEHDKIRDQKLSENGYKVYRIKWKSLQNEKEYFKEEIKKILNLLRSGEDSLSRDAHNVEIVGAKPTSATITGHSKN